MRKDEGGNAPSVLHRHAPRERRVTEVMLATIGPYLKGTHPNYSLFENKKDGLAEKIHY
jgi:hypothetical protein